MPNYRLTVNCQVAEVVVATSSDGFLVVFRIQSVQSGYQVLGNENTGYVYPTLWSRVPLVRACPDYKNQYISSAMIHLHHICFFMLSTLIVNFLSGQAGPKIV